MRLLLKKLKSHNVKLSVIDGELDIQAPKGVMTPSLLEEIKANKNELLTIVRAHELAQGGGAGSIPLIPIAADYQVSSAQRRLWLLDQFEGSKAVYNMGGIYELKGTINLKLLKESVASLVSRHESLRTNFVVNEHQEPRQKIHPYDTTKSYLSFKDISQSVRASAELKSQLSEELNREFDLATDALFQATLIQHKEDEYVLLLLLHHIIGDGWSTEVMCRELFGIYDSLVRKETPGLPPLPIQYKDYATWQQQLLSGEKLADSKAYWLGRMSGDLPVLSIRGYQPRMRYKTYKGDHVKKVLDGGLSSDLQSLWKKLGATTFAGLLTTVRILLSRYSNQQDLVIGTPVSGRENPILTNQVGNYVNTLALRGQVIGTESFRATINREREELLKALSHQSYPFDELLDELQLERDTSRNPLFDVLLTFAPALESSNPIAVDGLSVQRFDWNEGDTSKVDLEFAFEEAEKGMQILLTYNTDLYSKDFAEEMLDSIECLLVAIANDADCPIDKLELLSPGRKTALIENFGKGVPYAASEETILSLFEKQLASNGNGIALISDTTELTYRELGVESNRFANYLLANFDIQKEELIGVQLERNEWLLTTLLAVQKAGAAYVPLDPGYPKARIEYIASDSNCRVVIDQDFLSKYLKEQSQYGTEPPKVVIKPSDLAYVIYTSGSTGKPKGVMLEHRNAVAMILWAQTEFDAEAFDVVFASTSHCFDLSVYEFFYPLSIGKPIRILNSGLDIVNHLASDEKILINTVPSVVGTLLEKGADFSNVGVLNMAGEVIPPHYSKALPLSKMAVRNLYGPSEDTTYSSSYQIQDVYEYSIPVGKPVAGTNFYVLSESGKLQPRGVVGELYIGGVGLSRGYLNKPELTAGRFVTVESLKGERLYKTGDLVRWLPDGNLEFIGRMDNQVKLRGYRIELGEIEKAVLDYPKGIKQAAVLVKWVNGDPALVSYYVPEEAVVSDELRGYLENQLPSYMVPSYYVALEALPQTPNGKLDRRALPDVELGHIIQRAYVAPRDETEEQLVLIWQEILGVEKIGVRDNFFELGGNSLKAVRVLNKMNSVFNVTLSIEYFFNARTIENVVAFLNVRTEHDRVEEESEEFLI